MGARAALLVWLSTAVLAGGLATTVAPARAEDDGARREARERFDRGLARFAEGDFAGALAEFERAQAVMPNPLVLFNIGLVYAALGRPVEAVDALERVLAAPGGLAHDRIEQARAALASQAERIGSLEVSTNVEAAIEVDGLPAGRTPLAAPLRVASGTRVVTAIAPGHAPARREITLAGGARERVVLELIASERPVAQLELESPLPGAAVYVDGERLGVTPLAASIAVKPGRRVIELRRAGYLPARRELALDEGARARLRIDLERDPATPRALLGVLSLSASEPNVEVTVNGRSHGVYRAPLHLPEGPHHLRIERAGFEPQQREVAVRAGEVTEAHVTLPPTPRTRLAHVERVRARARLGYILSASGLALAAGGSALGIWGQSSLPELEQRLADARQGFSLGSGGACDTSNELSPAERERCQARIDDADADLAQRRTLRTLGFVTAGGGAALAVIGVVLLAGNDDEHRYDALALSPWATPGGGGANVHLRF